MGKLIKKRPALVFLVFIVLWTWIFMAAIIALVPIDPVAGPGLEHVALVFLVASPSLFGILFARWVDGKKGVRALFARAVRWRVGPIWYAVALLSFPALYGLSYLIQGRLGGSLAPIDFADKLLFAIPIALLACVMEEFGWRGFALPKLLERHSALKSALIVGAGWALWHAPINYLGLSKFGVRAVPILFVLAILPVVQTIVMTWIHNSTQQSMLMMLLAHFGITGGAVVFSLSNTTAGSELRIDGVAAGVFGIVAAAVIVAAGAKRLSRGSPKEETQTSSTNGSTG